MPLDVLRERNPATGAYRLVMKDGNPVMVDSLQNAILELLSEDPWAVQETPRSGNLQARFPEQTAGYRDAFAAAVEDALQPLLDQRRATAVRCTEVRTEGSATLFVAEVDRPGKGPERYPARTGGRT